MIDRKNKNNSQTISQMLSDWKLYSNFFFNNYFFEWFLLGIQNIVEKPKKKSKTIFEINAEPDIYYFITLNNF